MDVHGIVDLRGKVPPSTRNVRIVTFEYTSTGIRYSQFIGRRVPTVLTRLDPVVADLRWRGFSAESTPDGGQPSRPPAGRPAAAAAAAAAAAMCVCVCVCVFLYIIRYSKEMDINWRILAPWSGAVQGMSAYPVRARTKYSSADAGASEYLSRYNTRAV